MDGEWPAHDTRYLTCNCTEADDDDGAPQNMG
jgi:hypothetical protein